MKRREVEEVAVSFVKWMNKSRDAAFSRHAQARSRFGKFRQTLELLNLVRASWNVCSPCKYGV